MTLKNRYKESIRPKLLKELGLKNIHQVPKVVKVNVNRGLGEAASNWWRGGDLNFRPSGYEPDELPDCSTPRHIHSIHLKGLFFLIF